MIEATLMICFTACTIAVTFILWILSRFESVKELVRRIDELEESIEKKADSIEAQVTTLFDLVVDSKCGCGKERDT